MDLDHPKQNLKLYVPKYQKNQPLQDPYFEFSGRPVQVANNVLDVKNEWRNDDLTYFELFPEARLSNNLRKQMNLPTID